MLPSTMAAAAILDLFTSRQTASLHERQASELSRYVAECAEAGGCLVGELPMLQTLLTLASERTLEGRFAFGPVMCELLDVACEPFVEVRANEAIIAAAAVGDFLRTVAELIVRFDGHDVSLQLAAAEVLSRFAAETSCELVERSGSELSEPIAPPS